MKKLLCNSSLVITTLLLVLFQFTAAAQQKPPYPKKFVGQSFALPLKSASKTNQLKLNLLLHKIKSANRFKILPTKNTSSCLPDTIILTTQAQINNFSTTYTGCTDPKYLFIDGSGANPAITSLSGLSGVTAVSQKLKISHTSLSSLSQLTSLTQLGALELRQNNSLTIIGLNNLTLLGGVEFRGLPALTSIAGLSNHITSTGNILMDTTALTNLAGLSGLTQTGDINIQHTPITNLSSLNNLTSIGFLWLQDDPLLTTIGLSNLTQLDGFIVWDDASLIDLGPVTYNLINKHIGPLFIYNTQLTSPAGLDSLTSADNIFVGGNANLTSLHGFENLTAVDNGLSIWFNLALTNITGLSGVTSILYDRLEVSGNSSLTSLTGLGNLQTIGGGLWLQYNGALTSLSALNNNLDIQSNSGYPDSDSLRITDNDQLSVCASPPICNFLAKQSSAAIIYSNATGCNALPDIQANCAPVGTCPGGVLKTWTGALNNGWFEDLNWSPTGIPGICDSVLIPANPNYPISYNPITISGLRMEKDSHLDMNAQNITINGNIYLDTASIGNGNILEVHGPKDAHIDFCTIYIHSLSITGFTGGLRLFKNYINGDVTLIDSISRAGPSVIDWNYIQGNLTVTANSPNPLATTNISPTQTDGVIHDAILTANSDVAFNVGFGSTVPFAVWKSLILKSDFPNNFHLNNVVFVGSDFDGHLTQLGTAPVSISYVNMNKDGNKHITLDQDVTITSHATFDRGWFESAPDKLLVFTNNADWSYGGYYNSMVKGPVKKIGNNPFSFPIGDVAGNVAYRGGCFISARNSATDEFTATFHLQNPASAGYDTAQHVSSLQTVRGKEYWTIERNTGNSSVQVALTYDSARGEAIPDRFDLRVASWNGSQWINNGNSVIQGTSSFGNVYSLGTISSFGAFALGLAPHRIPKITIANADTIGCAGFNTSFFIHFTLDTAMVSSNLFKVQISDSSGSFTSFYNIGQRATSHSDSILCSIPPNYPYGTNYRIRIVGDAPPDTSASKKITVQPFPYPELVVHGQNVGCIGGGTYKYWVTPVQQGITYNWSLNNPLGTITSNYDTAYVTWTTSGYLAVQVQNANSCNTGNFAYLPVIVSQGNPTAAPIITNTGRWLYASSPAVNQYATGYHWYQNDILISGASGNAYYATSAGSFKATYQNLCGDGPESNAVSFAAASIPQTISFSAIPNKTYGDSSFVIPASASSGLPVSFNIVNGPGNIPGNVYNITGTGLVTIKATQPGDNVYDTAAIVNRSFTINKAAQTITFAAISDKDFATTTSLVVNATSSSNLAVSYNVVSGPATIIGNAITLTGLGTVIIKATQAGDTNYLPAPIVSRSFCVRISSLTHITGPASICPGVNATYAVNNIIGATYTWRIAGGSTLSSTTSSVTHIWPAPGTYTLIASATGNCGAASKNDTLTITAITSVQPDSVHNMLPVNGAQNQQLPLTLSWIPANPNLFYTYDVYIWRADTLPPSVPYVTNLTTVNYTIPLYSGLPYGQTYKWMVAAHNGSCAVTKGGPVQTFALIPLPDLQVYNINGPATAFSGQQVSVSWKVKNNGPGNTQLNQQWTDAVFISVDSVFRVDELNASLPFPLGPMLVAIKPNVTALNAGQFYDDTANFTIPIKHGGPLYMHVVTNYAPPAINPVIEITKLNDTAHALPPTIVTLSPQPDLRVDTVFNPNNTFSGSTINVTFKVKNHNVNATGSTYNSWIDAVYISKDAVFNIKSATLLKRPNYYYPGTYYPNYGYEALYQHNGGLQQDSSYTAFAEVIVPNFIYGSYYVYVVTDEGNSLYEGPNENNNINHGNLMQVFLTPTPKLTPVNVLVDSTISTTQSVAVTWSVQNQGAYDNIERNQGHYYVRLPYPYYTCGGGNSIPTPVWVDSLGFGSSYWVDKIYLSTDSTGLNLANATLLNTVEHGSRYNRVPGGVQPNHCGYTDNLNTVTSLLPNRSFPISSPFSVPSSLPQGDYYIYVYANPTKTVYEYPGQPQITRSNKITVSRPDITVPSVTVPTTGNSGQPLTVNYSILNVGPGAVYSTYRKDYIYMGNNSTFDSSATLLDAVIYPAASIPVNISQPLQKVITLPNGVSGSKFFFIRANGDSSFKENNLNNNINAAGAPITISLTPPPDLQVTSVVMADTIFSVLGFPFKYTVTNTGSGLASGTWKDSIFISCSNSFNPSTAYFVGVRGHQLYIPAAGNYSDSFSLGIPITFGLTNAGCLAKDTAQVYFFVKTNADNGLYEPVNNNNIGSTGAVKKTVINALIDQIVTNVNSGDSARVGQNFSLSWTVQNIGYPSYQNNYFGWVDAYYFSPDSVINANAMLLGFQTVYDPLSHNQTYTLTKNFNMPVLPPGDYYLHTITNVSNSIFSEHNLTNNSNLRRNASGVPIKVHLSGSPVGDVIDSIITAPTSTAVGQPLKIVYKVKNIGPGAINSTIWYDEIWLSSDLQPAGLFLGSKTHGALASGTSYTDSIIANIPLNYTQGNYVIVVRANAHNFGFESNYENNTAYQYISVYTPAPTDLVVNNIIVTDTLILGNAVPVSWKLDNISNAKANGIASDGIYLSSDSLVNSSNDILIGIIQNLLNILPLGTAAASGQAVVNGVTEGSYFLKVKTDILNNLLETNKLNNTGVRNKRVYVTVKNLPLNVLTTDTLTPSFLYYKLVLPLALRGRTVAVKLTSNDSLTANNQVYVGLGYLPSAAHFDYTFSNANFGNQQIIIESVLDSVYYIATKGTKTGGGNQVIKLLAVELPFAITSVNANHGGNTGNVTVQIKGSLFTKNMTVSMHSLSPNNTVTASAIYFVNSTNIYATFNLSGVPKGLYDVILKKPDLSVATLPSSFTVEQTNNGGLITGAGANTGQIGSGNAPGCDPGAPSGLNSQLQTELIIPPYVFVSWPFIIQINYTNASNVDIPAQVKVLYSLGDSPLALTEAGLTEGKTSLYIEFKDTNGLPDIIRAGGTGTIKIYSKAPANATAHMLLNFTFQ